MRQLIWISTISIFIMSCKDYAVLYQKEVLVGDQWNYDKGINFAFTSNDSTAINDFVLTVHHNKDFDFANMYVKMKTTFPDKTHKESIVSLEISDKGKWLGKCSGETCKTEILLQEKSRLKNGKYILEIFQHSRLKNIDGILAFDLEIRTRK